jgi:hypothetical protein
VLVAAAGCCRSNNPTVAAGQSLTSSVNRPKDGIALRQDYLVWRSQYCGEPKRAGRYLPTSPSHLLGRIFENDHDDYLDGPALVELIEPCRHYFVLRRSPERLPLLKSNHETGTILDKCVMQRAALLSSRIVESVKARASVCTECCRTPWCSSKGRVAG